MISKKEKLGVGIRGAGQVAAEHAKAIRNNPSLFLAAVCSRSEESAARLAREFAPEAKVYRNYEDLLADRSVDIVSICMPNYLHAREAIQAFEARKTPDPGKTGGHQPGRACRPSPGGPESADAFGGKLRGPLAPDAQESSRPAGEEGHRPHLLHGSGLLARDQADLCQLPVDPAKGVCRRGDDHRRAAMRPTSPGI